MIDKFLQDVTRAYSSTSFLAIVKAVFINPGTQACLLIRLSQCSGKIGYLIFRHMLIFKHGIDVGYGLKIDGGLYLPHPVNIVIGKGVVIEKQVTLYQGVTLGKSKGAYPQLMSGVVVFPNSVIVGKVSIAEGVRISALSFVKGDVND
ncbi:hypothetical protein [Rheinheimera gaetbuli]